MTGGGEAQRTEEERTGRKKRGQEEGERKGGRAQLKQNESNSSDSVLGEVVFCLFYLFNIF